MSIRFELTGECAAVNLVIAPTDAIRQLSAERVILEEVRALG